MRYSGSTNFKFEVERFKNIFTGELVTSDKLSSDDDFNFEYQTITLQVEGRSYFTFGRSSGLPEDCYPDEGDTEVESVIGSDGKDWYNLLTSSEVGSLLTEIQDRVIDDGPEDYEEDDYDDGPDSSDDLDDDYDY